MGVTADILATYRAPRRVVRRQLDQGQREERALVYLMLACGLIFIAQWPRLAREAALTPGVPFDALVGAALLGWLFVMPLVFYTLAGLSHLVARAFGGQGSWFGARLALFWALLCTAPVWLVQGLVAGVAGAGPLLALAGVAVVAAFCILWAAALREAERPVADAAAGTPTSRTS